MSLSVCNSGWAAETLQIFEQMPIPNKGPPNMSVFTTISRTDGEWTDIWMLLAEPLNETVVSVIYETFNLRLL